MDYEDYEYEEFGRTYRGCKLIRSPRRTHRLSWAQLSRRAHGPVLSPGPRGGRLMGYRGRLIRYRNGYKLPILATHDGLACNIARMFLASSNENPVQIRKSNTVAAHNGKAWFRYVATGKRR